MAFGPISDVVGFTHRDGQTYLALLEDMRVALNNLIAQYNTLPGYVRNLQSTWNADFAAFQDEIEAPITEYETLNAQVQTLIAELSVFATQLTDYVTVTTSTGEFDPDETTNTDYTAV